MFYTFHIIFQLFFIRDHLFESSYVLGTVRDCMIFFLKY